MINGQPVLWMALAFALVAYIACAISNWYDNHKVVRRKRKK